MRLNDNVMRMGRILAIITNTGGSVANGMIMSGLADTDYKAYASYLSAVSDYKNALIKAFDEAFNEGEQK